MLSEAQLIAACLPFGISGLPRAVRVSQNEVFEVGEGAGSSILRVSHGRGRTQAQVEAELDWIEDLSARGVDVCRARRSLSGRRCERVECEGAELLVAQFDRAPGRKIVREDVDRALCSALGSVVGRLHAASFGDFSPQPARPAWHESRLLTGDLDAHAGSQPFFRAAVESLGTELRSFAATQRLVHADVSFGNTFLDGSRLWLFDFDNCEVGPLEHDLAVVFYDGVLCHFLNRVPAADLPGLTRSHWRAFLEGYRSVRGLDIDLEAFRKFVVLREAVIYVHYLRVLDRSTLTDAWREGLGRMRDNVLARRSEVELDGGWLA